MSNDMALALENRPMVENPLDNLAAAIKGITFKLTVGGQKVTPVNAAQVLAREDLAVSDRDRILMALQGVQRQNKVLGSTLPLYPNDPLIDVIPTTNGGVIPILASNETAAVTYDGVEGVNPADTSFIEMPKWAIKMVNGLTIAALVASSVAPLGSVGKSTKGSGEHSGGPKLDFKAGVLAALAAFLAACQKAGIIPTNTTSPQLTSTPQSPDTPTAVLTATPQPTAEIRATPFGLEVPSAGGPDGSIIITRPEIFYPTNLDPNFVKQNQGIYYTPGQRIGFGLCTTEGNTQGPCYVVGGHVPSEQTIPFGGENYSYNPSASLPDSGIYIYTSPSGKSLLDIAIALDQQQNSQLLKARDNKGAINNWLIGPDGKATFVNSLISLNPGETIISKDLKNGTLTTSTGRILVLGGIEAQAVITLAHPKNSAECDLICPKITLDNLSNIQLDQIPLIPNKNGLSGISISQGTNTEVHIYSDNSIYLGATNVEFPEHPGVTGVLAAIKTINTERSEQKSVIVYLLQLVDGTMFHTTADVDKILQELNSGNFNITAVSKYNGPGNGTLWNKIAREITDEQDLGSDPLNSVNYDRKIIIN